VTRGYLTLSSEDVSHISFKSYHEVTMFSLTKKGSRAGYGFFSQHINCADSFSIPSAHCRQVPHISLPRLRGISNKHHLPLFSNFHCYKASPDLVFTFVSSEGKPVALCLYLLTTVSIPPTHSLLTTRNYALIKDKGPTPSQN